MKIYLVGGAVRDQLLGLPIKERDWVVVGSTPEEMLALGFQPVGKEFPVFLHPETHEEYALARTERKVGKGYKGFTFYTDPNVTLEQDLLRRDLTINAMAIDETGNVIDPYGGQQDLQQKSLHHVSVHFAEDPVRILRLARFAARFADFTIHSETMKLMQTMVQAGEVEALVAERVWQELQRALSYTHPVRFFTVLQDCGALSRLFPELSMGSLGMQKLATTHTFNDPKERFAILTHDVDAQKIVTLAKRLTIPTHYQELLLLVAKFGTTYAQLNLNHSEEVLQLILRADGLRRTERFAIFLQLCQFCFALENQKQQHMEKIISALLEIDTTELQKQNLTGQEFAKQLHILRIQVINNLQSH